MSLAGKHTGEKGESLAAAYLVRNGYRIVARNYRCCFGEIDIVAREGKTLVFVEVKSRHSEAYGDPQLAVGPAKQKKMSRIALHYLSQTNDPPSPARFDVVAVKFLPEGPRIEWIRDAFELCL